jgi:hypothetical protein
MLTDLFAAVANGSAVPEHGQHTAANEMISRRG